MIPKFKKAAKSSMELLTAFFLLRGEFCPSPSRLRKAVKRRSTIHPKKAVNQETGQKKLSFSLK
ncbi:hypothetical protein AZF04_12650 [Alkalihalobacillus trypoxylicola]|uniref:Uncharacterized protein n=1 Tax=Alkalihalobacillus trypoxylicola TaxID=519424 RepID=A0A162CU20_9BACI|nr:hypothetical protein AZF04_12650 [Alkalihalobacillus trypoxylicola]